MFIHISNVAMVIYDVHCYYNIVMVIVTMVIVGIITHFVNCCYSEVHVVAYYMVS